jgi:Zn-finger nucleic acid-binding protein
MKRKIEEGKGANEMRFELKYCERCGGLWLRPVGGEQVYCVICARQMAELPPASHEVGRNAIGRRATMQKGPQWGVDHCDYEDVERGEEGDLDTVEVWHE